MKSYNQKTAIQKLLTPMMDLISSIGQSFLPKKYEPVPQQFTHVTERFDVVRKLPYRGWVLNPDNK